MKKDLKDVKKDYPTPRITEIKEEITKVDISKHVDEGENTIYYCIEEYNDKENPSIEAFVIVKEAINEDIFRINIIHIETQ